MHKKIMNFLSGANTTPSDLDSTTNRQPVAGASPSSDSDDRLLNLEASHWVQPHPMTGSLRWVARKATSRSPALQELASPPTRARLKPFAVRSQVTFFKLFLVIIIPMFNDFNSKCLPELTLEAFNKIHHLLHSLFHTFILRSETRLFSVHFF